MLKVRCIILLKIQQKSRAAHKEKKVLSLFLTIRKT
jgi:hypothetical protein